MKARELLKWCLLPITVAILLVLLLEVCLRVLGIYYSHAEDDGGEFYSAYSTFGRKDNWAWPTNETIPVNSQEFQYSFKSNSLGVRDSEHRIEKDSGMYRILMLGDSYMESFGVAHDDSTILRLMEWQLNSLRNGQKYEVMSGASAGSDLFFNFHFYKNKLVHYKPDLVILNINSTDIMDYCVRGGLGRIGEDGAITFAPCPINESLYSYSHLYRFWVHDVLKRDRNTFLKTTEMETFHQHFLKEAKEVIAQFQSIADVQGTQFRVVLYPVEAELTDKQYPKPLINLKTGNTLDVMDGILEHKAVCKEPLYWPIDGHFTPHGYAVFSNLLVNRLFAEETIYLVDKD